MENSVQQPVPLTRYAWLSIAAALVTITMKSAAYLLTGSVGLLSDALESTVNLAAAVVALRMGTLLGGRSHDRAAGPFREADTRGASGSVRSVVPPLPGAVLVREYRGREIRVTVLPEGFEHEGRVHRSLTAVAREVTGSHWNGFHFFGMRTKGHADGHQEG